jgi:aminoglycoside N3'-acetyltransferase
MSRRRTRGIVDWPGEDYFATILRDYLAAGRAKHGRVGQAASELIEARDVVDFGTAWMNTRFRASSDPPLKAPSIRFPGD